MAGLLMGLVCFAFVGLMVAMSILSFIIRLFAGGSYGPGVYRGPRRWGWGWGGGHKPFVHKPHFAHKPAFGGFGGKGGGFGGKGFAKKW